MANFDEINENYSSKLIDDLLNHVTPEEQERINYKMLLAAKIHAALKAKGWKSLDLANALGLKSPSLVSKWLSGTHNFTIDTLLDIQRVLDIQFFNFKESAPTPTLYVNFKVLVEPASLQEDISGPLQRVIDETGGLQATTFKVETNL
jgi:transcriptional regulator with XRE-family HTH domain